MISFYSVKVSFVYYDKDEQGMREHTLSKDFLAENHEEALDMAPKWAANRMDNYMRDAYEPQTEIGCITVGERTVERPEENGFIGGGFYQFFQWKYDYPGTYAEYAESWKAEHKEEKDNG